jgi:hypothetical protein
LIEYGEYDYYFDYYYFGYSVSVVAHDYYYYLVLLGEHHDYYSLGCEFDYYYYLPEDSIGTRPTCEYDSRVLGIDLPPSVRASDYYY